MRRSVIVGTLSVRLSLVRQMQDAESPSCLRFSFTGNKLEKSRKPSSSACACLCHDWNGDRDNFCQSQANTASRVFRTNFSKLQGARLATPFNDYFLFIVRPRNSRISEPMRSDSSSSAKWPVSKRWSSARGISLFKSSAPSTVKIPSFFPHVISVGG